MGLCVLINEEWYQPLQPLIDVKKPRLTPHRFVPAPSTKRESEIAAKREVFRSVQLLKSVKVSPVQGVTSEYVARRWAYALAIQEWIKLNGSLNSKEMKDLFELIDFRDEFTDGVIYLIIQDSPDVRIYYCQLKDILSKTQVYVAHGGPPNYFRITGGGITDMERTVTVIERRYGIPECMK